MTCGRRRPRFSAQVGCIALSVGRDPLLAPHKPFFTAKVSETLLDFFLKRSGHAQSALTPRERGVVQLIAEGTAQGDCQRAQHQPQDSGDAPRYRDAKAQPAFPPQAKLDDVRIYDRALSPAEVQQLYKLGTARITQ